MALVTGIRRARPGDLDELVDVGRRSWLSAFGETAPFELIAWWARTDRTRKLYETCWMEMFVLDEGGVIAGLLLVKDDEINGLWIHPRQQGMGGGTALLRHGEELIAAAGHRVAWLTCSGFNARAEGFYRRRGYVEVGRDIELHVSGAEVVNVRLERELA